MENLICDNCGKQYAITDKEKIDKCDCGGQLSERNSLNIKNSDKTKSKTNLSNYINLKILLYSILIVIGIYNCNGLTKYYSRAFIYCIF